MNNCKGHLSMKLGFNSDKKGIRVFLHGVPAGRIKFNEKIDILIFSLSPSLFHLLSIYPSVNCLCSFLSQTPCSRLLPSEYRIIMAEVREMLQALTVPDTDVVKAATAALRTHLKKPEATGQLLALLADPEPSIRQLAAILLRKLLPDRIKGASVEDVTKARASILSSLATEQVAPPRSALIALASSIAGASKTDSDDGGLPWPEIIKAALTSANDTSLQLIPALADSCPFALFAEMDQLIIILRTALTEHSPRSIRAYVACMRAAVRIAEDPFSKLVPLLPCLAEALKFFAAQNAASDDFAIIAADAFECCQLGTEIGGDSMKPYFADSVSLASDMFRYRGAANKSRSAAAEYLMLAASSKPKTTRTLEKMPEILRGICEVASEFRIPSEGEDEFNEDSMDEEYPCDVALRVLESLASKPEFMQLVFRAAGACATALLDCAKTDKLQADRDSHSAAAYRIMASISEGCAVMITEHAADIVAKVAEGAISVVLGARARSNALYALTYVTEWLDTEEMPSTLISSVGGYALNAIISGLRDPVKQVRESACSTLQPVLNLCLLDADTLQPRFSEIISALGSLGPNAATEAVVAVGILAQNAPDEFVALECLPDLVHATLVQMAQLGDDQMDARVYGFETAGCLVSVVKDKEVIEKLAAATIVGLHAEEPNVKRATFAFFARMADAVGAKAVIAYGVQVLKVALASMGRDDVEFIPDEDEANGAFGGLASAITQDETQGDTIEADDEEVGKGSFHIRTAYLDEKQTAVAVCGAFASASSTAEYVEAIKQNPQVAREIQALLKEAATQVEDTINYFHEEVRAASQKASVRYTIANVNLSKLCPALMFDGTEVVSTAIQRIAYCCTEDSDSWTVAATLSPAVVLCDEIPADILAPYRQIIVDALKVLIKGDAMCQITEDDADMAALLGDEDEGEDVSGVANGVFDLFEALVRNQRGLFADEANEIFRLMLSHMFNSSSRNRGLLLGAVAGVLLFLSWDRCPFDPPAAGTTEHEKALVVIDAIAAQVLPLALDALCENKGMTLQRNAVFLTGIIFQRARPANSMVWGHLQRTASLLDGILKAAKEDDNTALVDNAAGAIARIVTASRGGGGPLGNTSSVLELLMSTIPMVGDPQENTTVARAVITIADRDYEALLKHIDKVVSCLTSATLLAITQRKEEENIRKAVGERNESDENDQMARLDDAECNKIVTVLASIRRQFGDAPFAGLKLKPEDATALSAVLPTS